MTISIMLGRPDPKVTFVIPALNVEDTIVQCLEAIFAQKTDMPFEVILLDNGSTDRTVEIAKGFDVWVFKRPGLSVAALRNLGAKLSKGDIIAYVDADCIISDDWLETATRHFNSPEVGAVGSPTLLPDNATWVQKAWYCQRKSIDEPVYVEWLPTENLLVRKDVFCKVGGFNEELITCEDVDFCYRINEHCKILCDPAIRSIHLGEARSLKHFFKKEFWRGKGNITGALSHGLSLKELPSIVFPVYYLITIFFVLIGLGLFFYRHNWWILVTALFMLLLPSLLLSFRTCYRNRSFKWFFALVILYIDYGIARALAILFPKDNRK